MLRSPALRLPLLLSAFIDDWKAHPPEHHPAASFRPVEFPFGAEIYRRIEQRSDVGAAILWTVSAITNTMLAVVLVRGLAFILLRKKSWKVHYLGSIGLTVAIELWYAYSTGRWVLLGHLVPIAILYVCEYMSAFRAARHGEDSPCELEFWYWYNRLCGTEEPMLAQKLNQIQRLRMYGRRNVVNVSGTKYSAVSVEQQQKTRETWSDFEIGMEIIAEDRIKEWMKSDRSHRSESDYSMRTGLQLAKLSQLTFDLRPQEGFMGRVFWILDSDKAVPDYKIHNGFETKVLPHRITS